LLLVSRAHDRGWSPSWDWVLWLNATEAAVLGISIPVGVALIAWPSWRAAVAVRAFHC